MLCSIVLSCAFIWNEKILFTTEIKLELSNCPISFFPVWIAFAEYLFLVANVFKYVIY